MKQHLVAIQVEDVNYFLIERKTFQKRRKCSTMVLMHIFYFEE